MGGAALGKRLGQLVLLSLVLAAWHLRTASSAGRGLNSVGVSELQQLETQQRQLGPAISSTGRQLLQTSYAATVCDAYSGSIDYAAVKDYATKLLGDSNLQLTDARYSGACNAFGLATFSAPHALAKQFSSALVLSTGDATAAAGDLNDPSNRLSTDLQQSGDASIGSYTYDAAVLEIDVSVAPGSTASSQQLVLSYMFASEEYGSTNPNPDALSITAKTSRGADYTDVAILPGGSKIPPPSTTAAATAATPLVIYQNTGSQYRTTFNGFTQVVPSQGLTVSPGGNYTLRISIADANNGLVDSVVMMPVGGLRLMAAPTASVGGPYSVAPSTQLTLAGSKSKSDNGAILTYLWRISPYNSSSVTYMGKGPTVTLPAPAIGQYNVTLDVWDVAGGHDQQVTALSVDAANVLDWWSATPSFATPSTASTVPKPTAVIAVNGTATDNVYVKARTGSAILLELNGAGSSDGRGNRLAYKWNITQTQPYVQPMNLMLGFAQPSAFVYSFDPGVYLVSLDVSGPGGVGSAQTLITIAANNPPVASAGGPYSTTVGVPVLISAEKSSDPDADPLTYTWVLSKGGVDIGTYTGPALSMKLNKAGVYSLKLTVKDDRGGASSTATQITSYDVGMMPSPPPPPQVVYAPPPVPVATPPATTTTVIAAVPAPPPNLRLSSPAVPTAPVYTTTPTIPVTSVPVAQQPVYTPQSGVLASPGFLVPSAPSPSPAPAMCLFSRDNSSSTNPWDSALSNPDWNNLDLLSWTNTYWAPCVSDPAAPVSGSNTSQAAAAVDPLASNAVIRSPEAFVTATGPATQVYLDAAGSTAAVSRSIIAFSWTVKRKSDNAVITQVDGLRTPVWLGPGVYVASLQITDTSGQTATTTKEFSIGDVAETLAYISSPDRFVEQPDGGSIDVTLSATGSKAGPGRSLVSYSWAVMRLPDNAKLSTPEGPTATASLPVGSYRVYLIVFDSGGGNATATKDFVVGNRDPSGVTAVITWPPALVQAASASGATTVALDGSGSSPANNGSTISQYVWAVVSMPNKQPVANATGRLATVNLPAGFYQVGLLVVDSDGNTATARKNFAISSTSSNVNTPPVVKGGLTFSGTAGGSFKITGVTDPDGDAVTITWALMDQSTGKTTQGKGSTVSLANLKAGKYLLLITADDGRSGESSGTASVTVLSKTGSTAATPSSTLPSSTSGSSSSGERLPAPLPPPPSSSGSSSATAAGAAAIRKLPAVALPQGSVMELDAAAFNVLPYGVKLDAYVWEMKQRSTGEQVATVYGRLGHFELSVVDTYDLKLTAYDTKGKAYSSTGSVRVVAPTTAAAALDPWMSFSGKCGPFSAKQYTSVSLSCPSLTVSGADAQLQYAWKLLTPSGAVKTKTGTKPTLVGLGPGHYRVELAIGVDGAPNNQNTAYYLVTYLKIQANKKLVLSLPQPLCAGQAVALNAPPLVQEGNAEPDYEWKVTWLESQQVLGYKQIMQGAGSSFGFTLQPGSYAVLMTATMADGAVVTGVGNITALACLKCRSGVVDVPLSKGKCSAGSAMIPQVLNDPVPDEVSFSWGSGTVTKPGQRKVTVVAKADASGMASSCTATVNFVDKEPPTVKLLSPSGVCVAPANSKWICWQANQLVSLSDNCDAVVPLAFMIACSTGSAADTCRVLPDGQACVKASRVGQLLKLSVMAKDGYDNMAKPVSIPVQVKALSDGARCQTATLPSPGAVSATV